MKKILALTILISSSCTFAASNEGIEQDIHSYSLLHGVSTAEANKALFLEANRDSALEVIEKEFKGRIAGIYIESSPTYKIVVRVKGYGQNEKRNVAVGNAISKSNLPIDIQYGAKETREVAKGQINKAQKLVKNYFNTIQTISYNEKNGNIIVEVKGKSTTENLKKVDQVQSLWKNPNLPIEIKFVNWTIKPLVDAHGGTFVAGQISPTMYGDCTTAFGIKNASGTKYMSTAAHCPNNFKNKADGTPYTFVGEILFAQSNDFQWNSTTANITNKFYVGPTTTRTLTGRRTLSATKIGESVCHYGLSTGYSCGTVEAVGTTIDSPGYPGSFWVKVNTNTCGHSDSGGPVFTALTIASGILSLGALDDVTQECYGYYYVPTDKIYENGFSFIY
ncbi:S1 family peptidase [Acinetobacter sp. V2]|uniref:S1 family peptidase n=1 Tax=Acinetobacter sp. V2 TaxID=1051623 RepID=UPI000A854BC9|nr:S1 family peptidase [Acinetobacter sp. V2]